MKAACQTTNRGNLALQNETWTIPIDLARKVLTEMKNDGELGAGKYWENHFAKPLRRAIRVKQETVRVHTALFSTSELSNRIYAAGGEIEFNG